MRNSSEWTQEGGKEYEKKVEKSFWSCIFLLKDRKQIQFSYQLVSSFHCTAEVHFSGALRGCQPLPQGLRSLPHPCTWPGSLGWAPWRRVVSSPVPVPVPFSPGLDPLGVPWLWLTPSPPQGLPMDPGRGWHHPLARGPVALLLSAALSTALQGWDGLQPRRGAPVRSQCRYEL